MRVLVASCSRLLPQGCLAGKPDGSTVRRIGRPLAGVGLMVGFLVFVSLAALFMTVVAFSPDPSTTDKLVAWGLCIGLWIATWAFARGLYRAVFARSPSRGGVGPGSIKTSSRWVSKRAHQRGAVRR